MRGRIICFVVSIVCDGVRYYLMREDFSTPDGDPEGFFVTDLIRAMKWTDRSLAEVACSAYEGAQVETIKTGEVLK